MLSNSLQFDSSNKLKHLLSLEFIGKEQILSILDEAQSLFDNNGKIIEADTLRDITVANLFFEPSTRTRNTFEIAAKKLKAYVINVDIKNSATNKGEDLLDTMRTLKAMQIDMFVIRHRKNKTPHYVAKNINGVAIINAGDGIHAHPTQALLDMYTIRKYKKNFENLSVAIVGDIIHSRVAHSDISVMQTLGVKDIRLIAPDALQEYKYQSDIVKCYSNLRQGIKDVDVIILLRIQKERMLKAHIPNKEYFFLKYGLDNNKIKVAKKDVIIMHPGPINRGVEINDSIADGAKSVILDQVTNGIAIRMAVMSVLVRNMKNG